MKNRTENFQEDFRDIRNGISKILFFSESLTPANNS